MKNYLTIILAACLVCLASCGSKASKQVEAEEGTSVQVSSLSVQGTQLVNDKGEKVVLHGVSYGWHVFWPRFYNASSVAYLANEWGAQVVRAAMGVEPEGAYLDNPEKALECVQAVVDAAIANNIYVIIDWHSHGLHTEEAKAFFQQMATRYKGVPNVIYEIFNEPVEDTWEQVKAYSEEVIKTIRAIEPDALILVGTPHWDQDVHLAADAPLTGYGNIMYTLHFTLVHTNRICATVPTMRWAKVCRSLCPSAPVWKLRVAALLTRKSGIDGFPGCKAVVSAGWYGRFPIKTRLAPCSTLLLLPRATGKRTI